MFSIHTFQLRSTLFEQLLIEVGLYYAVVTQKISHGRYYRPLGYIKQAASYGLTLLLLGAGLIGSHQLLQIAGQARTASNTAKNVVVTRQTPTAPQSSGAANSTAPATAALGPSLPLELQIPAISLTANISLVGLNADGTLGVPPMDDAGWYTGSPTPGEIGPSVIDGHVDSIDGIAVFWRLRELRPGDPIKITRQDGSTVIFTVEKTETYQQDSFPSDKVYGNIDYAALRLITCDGDFNPVTRHYSHNLVVYARVNP